MYNPLFGAMIYAKIYIKRMVKYVWNKNMGWRKNDIPYKV